MGLLSWYRESKRAKLIGKSFTGHWYDPETGKTWMCGGRYGLRVMDGDSPESIAKMCHYVKFATLTEYGKECLPEKLNSRVTHDHI